LSSKLALSPLPPLPPFSLPVNETVHTSRTRLYHSSLVRAAAVVITIARRGKRKGSLLVEKRESHARHASSRLLSQPIDHASFPHTAALAGDEHGTKGGESLCVCVSEVTRVEREGERERERESERRRGLLKRNCQTTLFLLHSFFPLPTNTCPLGQAEL